MPGKVNPVICEAVIQVACQVVGCDAAIAAGATGGVGGILELNVAMPMIADNLLDVDPPAGQRGHGVRRQVRRAAWRPTAAAARELVEQSLAMCTALAPRIGYDAAAEIAKEAYATGKTVRQVGHGEEGPAAGRTGALLDARGQTGA